MTLPNNSKRRKELVAIAARLFFEQGYERTTVRMLADAMGIKSGSLFHHFNDKQEILCAVIQDGMESAIEIADAALADVQGAKARFRALARAHLSTLLNDRNAHVVALYEWRSLSESSLSVLIGMRDHYEQLWQQVIDECVKEGVLKGDTPLIRRFTLGALNWTVQWYDAEGEKTPDDLANALSALIGLN
ncbi:transcriptional regulator, TetR family [Oceanospirillum multiglobuliferum]|uniref:TetR family transcriptional regulator n=1 Tax=Oceanospirillum multiglobuliferum TaxID=64969 RepID=A0A1T4RJS7_9GAMM|nr:TetR/AcrR family transcriptional regulator [Oceanospirillum multiglobuliferum]OPX54811.1 TetR family transcriptional regulator [Oceanospirillum multiglobuliferum]SKA15921.1 transcriptional regulator, TetR family [Oceanospirillum multiglobuliferum]